MKWFDWIKKATGFYGHEKAKERLTLSDPTSGYHSYQSFYHGDAIINDLPLFTIWTGRMMLRSDPVVSFALNVRNACLMGADFEVKAKNPKVKAWVEANWSKLWDKHRIKLTSAKKFGFAALQVLYKQDAQGLLTIDGLKDFAPEDVRPLEHAGKVCGFRVKGAGMQEVKLKGPRALWVTFNAEYGSPYGQGILRRQYPPWYEKWMPHGSKKLTQQRMIKDAYVGDVVWYPPNLIAEMPDGQGGTRRMPWKDVLREIVENRLSGGAMTMPNFLDDKGNKLVDYQPPQGISGATDIFQWTEYLDEGIFMGADVPLEVVQASETGSGFSGRSIPLMVVLSVCTDELIEITQCVSDQVLRPAAWLNFGGDPEFEIKPKPLVESFAQDAGGSPMGGGAVGGQPGSKPPGQSQTSQNGNRMGWVDSGGNVTQFDESDARWITIGGRKEGEKEHAGGFPVQIDTEGRIVKSGGHQGLVGQHVNRIGEFFRGEQNRKAHEQEVSDWGGRKGWGTVVARQAARWKIDPEQYEEKADDDAFEFGANQFDEGQDTVEELHASPLAAARRRILTAAERIRALKKKSLILPRLAELIEVEIMALRPGIQSDLSASIFGGHVTGMADGIASVPASFEPPTQVSIGPPVTPPPIPPPAALLFPEGEPDGVRFPVIDDSLELLESAPTASTLDYRQTAALAREGAFAVTSDLTDQAVADVRDVLAKTIREGGSEADFVDTIVSRMGDEGGPLSEAHLAQVFRTNTSTAISDGQHKALAQPLVADAFPYRAYFATTDQRVRPEHIALERLGLDGTNIYRADDPTWLKFRPPWDFGCRCSWSPATVLQASRQGVTEAKEWWARAKAMADQLGGSPDEYLARTSPPETAHVMPPLFSPSPVFVRS